jgi:predicted nucleic acid-binding protein
VEETLHDKARHLLKYQREIQAPDFILIEVANVAWKKAVRKEISTDQVWTIVHMIPQFIPLLLPSSKLLERTTELAVELTHPIYDCLYLACVEEENDALVTADKRFFNKISNSRIGGQIRFLDDPDLSLPLYIPLHKIDEIIKLWALQEITRESVRNAFAAERSPHISTSEEMSLYMKSPAVRRIRDFINRLPREELVDVLALGWLGQGYSGADWQAIHERANEMIGGYANNGYLYVIGLSCYLDRGLNRLRKQHRQMP